MTRAARAVGLAAAWLAAFGAVGLAHHGRADRSLPRPALDTSELWDDPPPPRALTDDESQRLASAARAGAPGVLWVGHPRGDSGTAFVVSVRYRLLATNAHVAAILDESGALIAAGPDPAARYRVARVWYHPNYFAARSRGSVVGRRGADSAVSTEVAPDVAVLQLEPGGPPLGPAWPLAGPEVLGNLTGRAVGRLGVPGRPRASRTSPAFAAGVITRDRAFAPRDDLARRWHLVDASTPLRQGESGGPIFLEDGRVVGIATWARSSSTAPRRPLGAAAIRVDALWELLRAYRMAGLAEGS